MFTLSKLDNHLFLSRGQTSPREKRFSRAAHLSPGRGEIGTPDLDLACEYSPLVTPQCQGLFDVSFLPQTSLSGRSDE